ncbi:fasciclin domain-containing protein [Deinococcus apachensis]|uniref:fasciclin domain-containing protein n=1 Tax=Deinococcus apachensis TaxID=309886 RepID=UPI0003713A46|nr:fasciclin domain-containing protein [Deinococcus apachensis]
MKKQTSLVTLSLMLATPALAGGAGAPVTGGASGACRSIAQIVSTDPQFSTLLTAVQAAGLTQTLSSGQYTVFAPTNAAFAKLPSDQLAAVLNDPEMLRGVLLYHVVSGKVTSKQVASLRSVKTAQGANLTVSTMGSRVMINNANVVRADVAACNGVIHVIDTVLVPPMAAAPAPAATTPAETAPAATTTETATTTDTSTTTTETTTTDTSATTATDTTATDTSATTTTETAATATTTAPAAIAITSIPALPLTGATVSATGATTTTTTTDTAAAGTTTDTAATDTSAAATTTDTTATTTDTTTTTETSTTTDTSAATGTTDTSAATTDTSATDAAAPATNTLYDVIAADDRFSTLRDLLSDAGLTGTLTSGEYTVFAPTNEAFDAIPADQLAALSADADLLKRVLSYHVVQGRISAEQLAGGAVLNTAEGSPLTPSGSGASQMVGTATISETVSTASNGTIYVINQVLLPPGVTLPTGTGTTTDTTAATTTTETTTTTDTSAATGTTTDTSAATGTTTTDTSAASGTAAATTTTAATTAPASGTTLVALLSADPRFSTLVGLIQQAGLAETLAGGEYTVFAPTNDAFAKIPAADLTAITADPARLRALLLYHVVQGRQTAEQLAAATQLTSAQGGTIALNLNGTTQVVGGANVSERLDTASNGTVYVIDTVLTPPNP